MKRVFSLASNPKGTSVLDLDRLIRRSRCRRRCSLKDDRGLIKVHSPFAYALIEALQGKADAFPPAEPGKPVGDGVITASELYLYLRARVEIATQARAIRQTPGIYPLNKHDKGEYIFLTPGHALNLPPAPPLDASKNPYRGLSPFEEEHCNLFFGRNALTQKLYEFVTSHPLTCVGKVQIHPPLARCLSILQSSSSFPTRTQHRSIF